MKYVSIIHYFGVKNDWKIRYKRALIMPFIIALIGIVADYLTTSIGLSLGFYETHPQYHPVIALAIFWIVLSLLTLALPNKKEWIICKNLIASASFLGSVNNTLVMLRIFPGLVI